MGEGGKKKKKRSMTQAVCCKDKARKVGAMPKEFV